MDVVRGVKQYVSRMIAEAGTGMKVLIMDKETVKNITMEFIASNLCYDLSNSPLSSSFIHRSVLLVWSILSLIYYRRKCIILSY